VQTLGVTREDGGVVLGTVELTDGAVLLKTNSQQRAERGQALLLSALEGLIGPSLVEVQNG